jgi:hypothetical protein
MCGQIGTSTESLPLLYIPVPDYSGSTCVEKCPAGSKEFFYRCIPEGKAQEGE